LRRRKWLLVVFGLLLAGWLGFFFFVRAGWADSLFKNRLEKLVAKELNAQVSVGELSANDRQAYASDIVIHLNDGSGDLSVRRLYVQYNLWKLLVNRYRLNGVVTHISVEEPLLFLHLQPRDENKERKPFRLPDLSGYFHELTVKDGRVILSAGDSLYGISQEFNNIQLEAHNSDSLICRLDALAGDAPLHVQAAVQGSRLISAALSLGNWRPTGVFVPVIDSLDCALSADVRYTPDSLRYALRLADAHVEAFGRVLTADSLLVRGGVDSLLLASRGMVADGQSMALHATLRAPFSGERPFSGMLRGGVNVAHYLPGAQGSVRLATRLGGTLTAPVVQAALTADSLCWHGETLRDLRAAADWQSGRADIRVNGVTWRGNTLRGQGTWSPRDGLDADLSCDSLRLAAGGWEGGGALIARVNTTGGLHAEATLKRLYVSGGPLNITDLEARVTYAADSLRAQVSDAADHLRLSAVASLLDSTSALTLNFRRLPLSNILAGSDQLPSLNGELQLRASPANAAVNGKLRVYDNRYGRLDGFIDLTGAMDFRHNRSLLQLRTRHGVYNYEPFSLELLADGTLDSLSTRYCKVNDEIDLSAWARLRPSPDWGFTLAAEKLRIPHYLAYFMDSYDARQYGGTADLDLEYNRNAAGALAARVRARNVQYGASQRFGLDLRLNGTPQRMRMVQSRLSLNDRTFCELEGEVGLTPTLAWRIAATQSELDLSGVMPDSRLRGLVSMQASIYRSPSGEQGLDVRLEGRQCSLYGVAADTLQLELAQREKLLSVKRLYVGNGTQYRLSAEGGLAYNLLRNKAYSDTVSLRLSFEGDPLSILSDLSPTFSEGHSATTLNLLLTVQDEHLTVAGGRLRLADGGIKIKGQPEPLRNIAMDMAVTGSTLQIERAQFNMGEGLLIIGNEITGGDDSFRLGRLDLGTFTVRSNHEGILVNIPRYMPEKKVVLARINGRDDKYLRVTGPFDDIAISGDVWLSNGQGIYPSYVDNLLDLFADSKKKPQPEDDERESANLPLRLDLMLHFGENMRYVTHPADFLMNPDGYLHLVYNGDEFQVTEAVFTAESGTAEVFGTTFYVDYIQVVVSQFNHDARIVGTLYRKAADGTLITLRVQPTSDDSGSLEMVLFSDDPTDQTTMDILSKLRYNRSRDELSPQQQQSLLQDEALDMAGVELESAVFDPLISPVENSVRRLLHLDTFTLRPGVVRNLFSEYVGTEDPTAAEQQQADNEPLQVGAGLLLDNLSLSMGKYIARDVYLDYELLVQKTTDIESMDIMLNHTFILRYDLPWRLKLAYKYIIDEEAEEKNHEIMLERNFRF